MQVIKVTQEPVALKSLTLTWMLAFYDFFDLFDLFDHLTHQLLLFFKIYSFHPL